MSRVSYLRDDFLAVKKLLQTQSGAPRLACDSGAADFLAKLNLSVDSSKMALVLKSGQHQGHVILDLSRDPETGDKFSLVALKRSENGLEMNVLLEKGGTKSYTLSAASLNALLDNHHH